MSVFSSSLSARLLTVTFVGTLISLVIALWGMTNINSSVNGYRDLISVEVESERTIAAMNYAFKVKLKNGKML